jgi:hypothetical protein
MRLTTTSARGVRTSLFLPLLLLVPLVFLVPFTSIAQAECPNEQLRQQNNSLNLPDCRAYEQVSPASKDGGSGEVLTFGTAGQAAKQLPMQSLADGSAITYPGEPAFDVPPRNAVQEELSQYTSVRSSSGWGTADGNTLTPESVPTATLPAVAEGTGAQVLEETPDGSKVFFLDEKHEPGITPDSNAAEGEPDLYEYTVPSPSHPTGELVDLTVDTDLKAGEPEHGDARGILGIGGEGTEEGSYVYFVAGGLLAPGASEGGCGVGEGGATGEGCNLYLRHHGTTTLIATLPDADEGGASNLLSPEIAFDWPVSPRSRTADVSPNGGYAAFANVASSGPYAGESEILRVDTGAAERHEQSIVCVSCSPVGADVSVGAGNARSSTAEINGADRQRYVLDDGRVFFTTNATLVPQDVNRQADVYEWENGAPHLISAGTSEFDGSVLTDASASGSDIFFTTNQSLVPEDGDEISDVYDAREGGGFLPPPEPVCHHEASCPVASAPPPAFGAPVSATFAGTENPPAAPKTGPPVKPKPLTRAQQLSKALRTCRKDKKRSKRKTCEAAAHRTYGPKRAIIKRRDK